MRYPLPPDMGGAAPHGVLEMFLIGNYREAPPLITESPGDTMLDVTLPAFGYTVIAPQSIQPSTESVIAEGAIENRWYRLHVDPATGGLLSLIDKELGRELISRDDLWRFGQYVYEWVDHPDDRRAIFALDFDREDFGVRHQDTPFRRSGPTEVEIMPAQRLPDRVEIEARMQAKGANSLKARYSLPFHEKALQLDLLVDKTFNTLAEAVYVPFPIAIENPTFHLDLNGVPLEPEREQLPGSCRDWYGVHRWAQVGDEALSVTLAPLDSPLIQVGGITTGRWARALDTSRATLVSWALHNHWDTNFKASQGEDTLLRYRLTSSAGSDPAASSRFAMNTTVLPLIVRVPGADLDRSGNFLHCDPQGQCEIQIKRAADGRGLILHAYNLDAAEVMQRVAFPVAVVAAAWRCTPAEVNQEPLNVRDNAIILPVPSRSVACARVEFQ